MVRASIYKLPISSEGTMLVEPAEVYVKSAKRAVRCEKANETGDFEGGIQ